MPRYIYTAEISVNTFGIFNSLAAVNKAFGEITGQRLSHRGRLGEIKAEFEFPLSKEALDVLHAKASETTKQHLLEKFPDCEPELGKFELTIDTETQTLNVNA